MDIMSLSRVLVIMSPNAQGLILGSAGHGSGMGFGTVLVRCQDQTWSLGRTGLSLSDPGLEWWKYVHLSSPFLGTTLPDTFPSLPSPGRPGSCHTCDKGEGLSGTIWQRILSLTSLPLAGQVPTSPATREVSFSYHLIAVGSLPVLPLSSRT